MTVITEEEQERVPGGGKGGGKGEGCGIFRKQQNWLIGPWAQL